MIIMSVGVIAVLRYWAGEGDAETDQSETATDPNELELKDR